MEAGDGEIKGRTSLWRESERTVGMALQYIEGALGKLYSNSLT